MSKYYGLVGYSVTTEDPTRPGIWVDGITTQHYYGDVIRDTSKWDHNANSSNDNLSIDNKFSIIADSYAYNNFTNIKFIEYMGQYLRVSSVEVQRPRLILSIGGKWNGNTQ